MFKEPRSSLPKVFLDSRVKIDRSPIHGWGCFASEFIDPHTIIESAPFFLVHKETLSHLYEMNDTRHVLQDYPFTWKDGKVAYAMGYAAVYNHNENNNCIWRQNYDYETIEIFTTKKINPGEELFVKYLPYNMRAGLWFENKEDSENINIKTAESFFRRDKDIKIF